MLDSARRRSIAARDAVRPAAPAILLVLVLFAMLSVKTDDLGTTTVLTQMVIYLGSSLGVFLLMRLRLLSFATSAFMAVGGYTSALLARGGTTNVLVLTAASFVLSALIALPVGLCVLRLKGTYFALVSFIVAQVAYLFIIVNPKWLGGVKGLVGIPEATLFGRELFQPGTVYQISVVVTIVAAILISFFMVRWRRNIDAVHDNEVLAESLGLRVWIMRLWAFMLSAGVEGMAGFLLVFSLTLASPESFSTLTSLNYLVYVVVGGSGSILGPLVGTFGIVWVTNESAKQGSWSTLLLGAFLIIVVLVMRGGIVGLLAKLFAAIRRLTARGSGDEVDTGPGLVDVSTQSDAAEAERVAR